MWFAKAVAGGQNAVDRLDRDGVSDAFSSADLPRYNIKVHFEDRPMGYSVDIEITHPGTVHLYFGRQFEGWERNVTVHRLAQVWPLIKQQLLLGSAPRRTYSMHDGGWANQVTFCSSDEQAILIPDCEFIQSQAWRPAREAFADPEDWNSRSDIPFWRGSNTGHRDGPHPLDLPRAKLCRLATIKNYDFKFSNVHNDEALFMDAGLMGDPLPWQHHQKKKYVVEIDGNSASFGFFMKLLSGAAILRVQSSHGNKQWFYHNLIPWHNYVPIASDFSDLDTAMQRLRDEPSLARAIGSNGRKLALGMTFDKEIYVSARSLCGLL